MKLRELLQKGNIELLFKGEIPDENEEVYYQVGEWRYYIIKSNKKFRVSIFTYDQCEARHRVKEWCAFDKFNKVSHNTWIGYSNDSKISEEEILHHNFIKLTKIIEYDYH